MRAHKVDTSQAAIVKALRQVPGCSVWLTTECGRGAPDMVVGYMGKAHFLECKSDKGKVNAAQIKWAKDWNGPYVFVVRTPREALEAIGVTWSGI
jgi:hypothetical protein